MRATPRFLPMTFDEVDAFLREHHGAVERTASILREPLAQMVERLRTAFTRVDPVLARV